MTKFIKKKKVYVTCSLIVLLCVMAGTVFYVFRDNHQTRVGQGEEKKTEKEPETEKAKEEMYLSLSDSDREIADLYAELYEIPKEDVAQKQIKTKDWDKTAEELEKDFFTIPENKKYQMEKEGYSIKDLQEAERLSIQTGRKAIDLAKAKGKASDHREWSEVVEDSEILITEEQLGLTKEQIQELENKSLEKDERVQVAILLMNGTYTFDEVIKELDAGKTVDELKE